MMIQFIRYRLADLAEALPAFIIRWWYWYRIGRVR